MSPGLLHCYGWRSSLGGKGSEYGYPARLKGTAVSAVGTVVGTGRGKEGKTESQVAYFLGQQL